MTHTGEAQNMRRLNTLSRLMLTLVILDLLAQFACAPPPPEVKPQNHAPVIENMIYAGMPFQIRKFKLNALQAMSMAITSGMNGQTITVR